jgi:hypothetical protein
MTLLKMSISEDEDVVAYRKEKEQKIRDGLDELSEETMKKLEFAVENKCALTWDFDKAPDELQELFHQGGDEDYIIFIPEKSTMFDCEFGKLN